MSGTVPEPSARATIRARILPADTSFARMARLIKSDD
jgi:hypothetical protein